MFVFCSEHNVCCLEHDCEDIIQKYQRTIDEGIIDWRNSHDTNCLNKLIPLVDSCVAFEDYCNRHDTLYAESYAYRILKINMLNSLKRYDEALPLIEQLPDTVGLAIPFGKNYLLKTTLIRKYNDIKDYPTKDSIINWLIEEMNFQFRANYGNCIPSDTVFYGRNLQLADTTDIDALIDYYLICIIRGDEKKDMINKVKQTFSTDEGDNMMYRKRLIDWINNADEQLFYNE